jgi:hypothetical protein
MLSVFYGPDIEAVRRAFADSRGSFLVGNPQAALFEFYPDQFDEERFKEVIVAQTLFADAALVSCFGMLENTETSAFIEERLEEIIASPNIFLLREGRILAPMRAKLKKVGALLEEHALSGESGAAKNKPQWDPRDFAVSDALGERDKRRLWVALQEAYERGLSDEEIFFKLQGRVRDMLMVKDGTETSESTGMKPFPFSKATSSARNFTREELVALSERLVNLYHEARRGAREFGIGLEQFVLEV